MNKVRFTEETLVDILLDAEKRANLIVQMESEQGSNLPLTNLYLEVGERCRASPDQLRLVIQTLLANYDDVDWLLRPFIFHSNVPDDILFDLYERGMCIIALAHRTGPRELLERLAKEHHIDEAIITLALDYYGKGDPRQLLAFLEEYKNNNLVRRNVLNSSKLSKDMRDLVLPVFGNQ